MQQRRALQRTQRAEADPEDKADAPQANGLPDVPGAERPVRDLHEQELPDAADGPGLAEPGHDTAMGQGSQRDEPPVVEVWPGSKRQQASARGVSEGVEAGDG